MPRHSTGFNVAITGAGSANTGRQVITGLNIALSTAGTLELRDGAADGTLIATTVLGAAGNWAPSFPHDGVAAASGTKTWWVVNSAGNVSGGGFGY